MSGGLTPEQEADIRSYVDNPDLAAAKWKTYQGEKWAERNPKAVAETDKSWAARYGILKSYAARDALRSVPRTGKWLELGCAAGAHLELMAYVGFTDLVGFDISLPPLKLHRWPRVQADALCLPFASGAFDGICMSGSLMHCGPDQRMRDTWHEIDRVARRWWFMMELWGWELQLVSFGELLPPAWLCPWDRELPKELPHWEVRYHKVYDLVREPSRRAPMCVTLLERTG